MYVRSLADLFCTLPTAPVSRSFGLQSSYESVSFRHRLKPREQISMMACFESTSLPPNLKVSQSRDTATAYLKIHTYSSITAAQPSTTERTVWQNPTALHCFLDFCPTHHTIQSNPPSTWIICHQCYLFSVSFSSPSSPPQQPGINHGLYPLVIPMLPPPTAPVHC